MIEAWKYAKELNGIFSTPTIWRLHSRFENGLNLMSENGSLLFIGTDKNGELPFAIHLTYLNWMKLKNKVTSESCLYVKDSVFYDQINPHFRLSIKEASHYESKLNTRRQHMNQISATHMIDFAKVCSLKNGFGQYLPVSYTTIMDKNEDRRQAFLQIASNDAAEIELGLRYFIGRGIGLTPSGDDFIVGVLAFDVAYSILNQEVWVILPRLLDEEEVTTDISKAYLLAAIQHQFSTTLIKIIHLLAKDTEYQQIKLTLTKLIKNGHTSGLDTLTGLLAGVFLYEELKKGD